MPDMNVPGQMHVPVEVPTRMHLDKARMMYA